MRTRRNPGIFILLVFLFSTPFWVTDVLIPVQLLPGLPLSSFSVVSVLVAATILVHREEGGNGVKRLFVKSFDAVRAKAAIWYLPAILLMPCIMLLSFLATRLSGKPIPLPQISLVSTLILLVAFFIAALCEELGWSGYATDPLQERFGALWASVLLGAVWAVWHFVPLLQAHRTASFLGWWTLGTVAERIIIVWLYNNCGKSVFMVALFHTMVNLTWQLYPVNGSFYDPRITGPITATLALLIVVVFGPKSLSRHPTAS